MKGLKKYNKLENIENNPKDIKIDFDEFIKINIKTKDIYNCELTGHYSSNKGIFHPNIVLCYLNQFISENSNFDEVDWKDSNLRNCEFNMTIFKNCAIINCHMAQCLFENSSFENISVTGTVFYETNFNNCDLGNIVIENCYFYSCKFINCKTSNKIFEQCLLINCSFENTDIQIDTITENFGIEKKHLTNSGIRDKAVDENHKPLSDIELQKLQEKNNISLLNIFKFKIEYFLKPEVISEGSELFDSIFNVKEWLILCKASSTFLNMFKLFHDFLIILFEQNQMPLFALYKLKELTHWLSEKAEIRNNFELYPAIIGYDIGLLRILIQSNKLIEEYEKRSDNKITLLVEGPLSAQFYYKAFNLFINGDFKIIKIVKQNSPNLMDIVSVTSVIVQIIALFVTTRLKVELINKKTNKKTKTSKIKKNKENISIYNLINLSDNDDKNLLKDYFTQPTIPYLIFTKHSTKDFGKIRKILKNI